MKSPLEWISGRPGLARLETRPALIVAFIVSSAFIVAFGSQASPPATFMTPRHAIELELAGTRDGALAILRAFASVTSETAKDQFASVRRSVYWDFGFIAGYSTFLSLLISVLSRRLRRPGAATHLDCVAGWAGLISGLFDVVENVAMLMMLSASPLEAGTWLGKIAFLGATASLVKWTLVSFAALYALWLILGVVMKWLRPAAWQGG